MSSDVIWTVKLGDVGLHGIVAVPPIASHIEKKLSCLTNKLVLAETEQLVYKYTTLVYNRYRYQLHKSTKYSFLSNPQRNTYSENRTSFCIKIGTDFIER